MKLQIYTIHDSGVGAFMQPFFAQNDGQAIRMFQDNINHDTSSIITKHPQDFTLFSIGDYDDQTSMINYREPISLGNGKQYSEKKLTLTETDVKQILENIKYLTQQVSLFKDAPPISHLKNQAI